MYAGVEEDGEALQQVHEHLVFGGTILGKSKGDGLVGSTAGLRALSELRCPRSVSWKEVTGPGARATYRAELGGNGLLRVLEHGRLVKNVGFKHI